MTKRPSIANPLWRENPWTKSPLFGQETGREEKKDGIP
jgi:hypothetical protein